MRKVKYRRRGPHSGLSSRGGPRGGSQEVGSSSHLTPRWSKADSNSESHPRATPPAATRFVADSALGEDGFELSVPGDTIKVLRSLHVVPANAKSARTSSDTGEPAVGDRLPIVAHRMNGGGHRRPARSPPWSGDPAERYAMRVLVGQPFHPASPSARSSSRSCRCLLGLRA